MNKNRIYIEPYPEDDDYDNDLDNDYDEYDDDDIPEIDLPKRNSFPEEIPYRNFPDGL